MTDTAPMNRIKDKPFSQRNKVEECILLVWEEIGLEHIAYKAAVELEALTAPQQQADGRIAEAMEQIDPARPGGVRDSNVLKAYDILKELAGEK